MVQNLFQLTDRVAVITGGAGLLGQQHAIAVAEMGGIPVLLDIDPARTQAAVQKIKSLGHEKVFGFDCDITSETSVRSIADQILGKCGRVDALINNAANNPQVEAGAKNWTRFENFPLKMWDQDLAVGLTGSFICSQVFGALMANQNKGVILNIASDLALISPDQRLYRVPGASPEEQPVKSVTYSIVKSGLLGLTKYLSTYWVEQNVRVNAISMGGVSNGQDEAFVKRLTQLIPMGRMARLDEYRAAVVFLISDASSYMTGANLVVDGGRTVW